MSDYCMYDRFEECFHRCRRCPRYIPPRLHPDDEEDYISEEDDYGETEEKGA